MIRLPNRGEPILPFKVVVKMQVEVSITESEIGLFEMDHGLHFTTYEQPHFELLPFNKTSTSQTFFDISKPLKDIQGLDSDGEISMLSTDVLSF